MKQRTPTILRIAEACLQIRAVPCLTDFNKFRQSINRVIMGYLKEHTTLEERENVLEEGKFLEGLQGMDGLYARQNQPNYVSHILIPHLIAWKMWRLIQERPEQYGLGSKRSPYASKLYLVS